MEYEELIHLLKTEPNIDTLDRRREEVAEIIPSVRRMFDFDQQNRAHQFDLWRHCLHAAIFLPRNLEDDMLYLAAMVHDIGKVDCQTPSRDPNRSSMHYPGHPARSAEILQEHILPEMQTAGAHFTEEEMRRFYYYVYYHDDRMKLQWEKVERHLDLVSIEEFHSLMKLEVADALAHVQIPIIKERVRVCGILSEMSLDELRSLEGSPYRKA